MFTLKFLHVLIQRFFLSPRYQYHFPSSPTHLKEKIGERRISLEARFHCVGVLLEYSLAHSPSPPRKNDGNDNDVVVSRSGRPPRSFSFPLLCGCKMFSLLRWRSTTEGDGRMVVSLSAPVSLSLHLFPLFLYILSFAPPSQISPQIITNAAVVSSFTFQWRGASGWWSFLAHFVSYVFFFIFISLQPTPSWYSFSFSSFAVVHNVVRQCRRQ